MYRIFIVYKDTRIEKAPAVSSKNQLINAGGEGGRGAHVSAYSTTAY
jgi:hypothetical protein